MTLKILIERLNWLVEDGVDEESTISYVHQFKDYIQIEFNNGIISQIDTNSSLWKINK